MFLLSDPMETGCVCVCAAFKYPIYGTQWHPEKNSFNWNPHFVINHGAHAVRVAQYFANFFVNEGECVFVCVGGVCE